MQRDSRGPFRSFGVDDAGGEQRRQWIPDLHCRAVPAVAERLTSLRHALGDWARQVGLSTELTQDVVLASYEAMANAVTHAYRHGAGVLDLHASYSPADGRVSVTVTDYGYWRPPADDPGPLHGRGLSLISTLAARAEVHPGPRGTTVRMHWPLHRDRQRLAPASTDRTPNGPVWTAGDIRPR